MLSLDGSTLEGGGQLVRVALALSAITHTPIRIYNIRANRAPSHYRRNSRVEGGLKESHLAALLWLAERTGARVEGAVVGSNEILFKPRRGNRRVPTESGQENEGTQRFEIKLKKPGSVWLIFQAILPYIVFGMRERRVELVLEGGMNVSKSMSGDYVAKVLLPTLRKIGVPVDVEVDVVRRGWAGNAQEVGEVRIIVERKGERDDRCFQGFEIKERGEIEKVVVSVVARPEATRKQVIRRVEELVKERLGVPVEVTLAEDSGDERRYYLLAVAHTTNGWRLGRDFLGSGAKTKDSTQLDRLVEGSVKRVVDELETEIDRGGCVDEYMQDQLVIFQALANGASAVDAGGGRREGTLHTRTVRWVCEQMLEPVKFGEDGVCEHPEAHCDNGDELSRKMEDLEV